MGVKNELVFATLDGAVDTQRPGASDASRLGVLAAVHATLSDGLGNFRVDRRGRSRRRQHDGSDGGPDNGGDGPKRKLIGWEGIGLAVATLVMNAFITYGVLTVQMSWIHNDLDRHERLLENLQHEMRNQK